MSEVGSTKTQEENLLDLPHDILSSIENDLGLLELMNLRGVCKYWRDVSSKALLKQVHESFERDPWFLLYDGEGSKCSLLISNRDRICTATIPELEGATCLASYEGWLLVFRGGAMFFFCPFSMVKIDIPSCPFNTELSGLAAAFSPPPTSQDCNVVLVRRLRNVGLEVYSLSRGHEKWTKHNFVQEFGTITAAMFSEGLFYFLDNTMGLFTFYTSYDIQKWNAYHIARPLERAHLTFLIRTNMFRSIDFNKLGLDENRVSISTCGTLYPYYSDSGTDHEKVTMQQVIPDESIEADIGSESPRLKGVWIMPRYHTPSMDHRW